MVRPLQKFYPTLARHAHAERKLACGCHIRQSRKRPALLAAIAVKPLRIHCQPSHLHAVRLQQRQSSRRARVLHPYPIARVEQESCNQIERLCGAAGDHHLLGGAPHTPCLTNIAGDCRPQWRKAEGVTARHHFGRVPPQPTSSQATPRFDGKGIERRTVERERVRGAVGAEFWKRPRREKPSPGREHSSWYVCRRSCSRRSVRWKRIWKRRPHLRAPAHAHVHIPLLEESIECLDHRPDRDAVFARKPASRWESRSRGELPLENRRTNRLIEPLHERCAVGTRPQSQLLVYVGPCGFRGLRRIGQIHEVDLT